MDGKRDDVKPRYDLIPLCALDRLAAVMEKGAKHYGKGNYLGFTEGQKQDIVNHAIAHLYKFIEGDSTEDHLAHVMANMTMYIHLESSCATPSGLE